MQRQLSAAAAQEELGGALPVSCVVQIFGTGVDPCYMAPWRVQNQTSWTGSGFCICERRIVTNAHCVADATVLQVQKQDMPKKWLARVISIAHDLDLAVIEVDDDLFWETVIVGELAPASHSVELYSEVNTIGFPAGGSTVCVTKGVISRFDAHVYAHPEAVGNYPGSRNSTGPVFILQVDSAINPGNSGGPAVDQTGKVVGVASSGMSDSQNVGYVIPSSIVHLYLNEVKSTSKWSGVSGLGCAFQSLECDSYRTYIGMDAAATGVLIKEVAPLAVSHGSIMPGDVLTSVDGLSVSNEGKVPVLVSHQSVYVELEALVTCKLKGEATTFSLLRKGAAAGLVKVTLSLSLAPLPPLAPRFHGIDARAEFVMLGGLIFSKASVPLIAESLSQYHNHESVSFFDHARADAFKKSNDHEVVVLTGILKHDINIGIKATYNGSMPALKSINGVSIKSLAHLASTVRALGDEGFACIEYTSHRYDESCLGKKFPDAVLDLTRLAASNEEICEQHSIPSPISTGLLQLK
jgi:S1-C subfamily serine protease